MTYNKLTLTTLIVVSLFLTIIQCSPSSDSMQDTLDADTSNLAMLSPKKGSENISTNSEFVWEKMDGTSAYEVQLSDQESFSNIIANLSVDTNRVAINGLPHDSKIYWRVRKFNNNQSHESWSQISHFKTESRSENSPPIAASLLSPTHTSPNASLQTNLEWTYVVNATNYQLQIAKDEGFENIILEESTTKTNFSVPDQELAETYYWRVLANVQGAETTWSDTWNYSTETAPSSAIELVYPQDDSGDEASLLTFKWKSLEGVSSYNIQVAADNSFENPIIDEVTSDTSFEASQLDVEKNYFWRIRKAGGQTDYPSSPGSYQQMTAANAGQLQNSSVSSAKSQSINSWSNTWSFHTSSTAKPRVQLSMPSNYSANLSTDLSFRWDKIDGVSEYRVMVATDDSFTNPEYDETVSTTNYKIKNLENNQTYYWGVQAAGSNKWSDTWVFKTGMKGSVPAVQLASPNDNSSDLSTSLTFEWKKIDGVSRYRVMVSTDKSFRDPEYDKNVSKTSHTINDLDPNETYYWGVMAAGSDQWSDTWVFETGNSGGGTSIPRATLNAPENNSSDQPTEVTFKWKKIDGVSRYRVMVSTDNSFENPEYDKMVSNTSYTIDNLERNETYYWGVKAEGSDQWSKTWSFETAEEGTVPRASLTAPENNSSKLPRKVTFKWKKVDGVSKYRVMVSTDNSFENPEYDKMVSQTSYTIDNLERNETYYWGVRANGSDQWSRTWSFTTGDSEDNNGGDDDETIPPVTLAAPSDNSSDLSTELTFKWEEIEGVSDYRVMVATDNSFSNPEYDATVSETSYSIDDLESGETYYWGVRAAGSNPWSETWSFTTSEGSTEIPPVELSEPLNNEDDLPTNVVLEWEEINQIDEYHLQIAMNNSFSNQSLVEDEMVDNTNYEVDQLSFDETYYWRVMADEGSEWSEVWSFNTHEESAIPTVTLIAPSNNSTNQPTDLTLEWQNIAGVNNYQVQVATNNSFSNPVYNETVSQAFIDINGLESGQTYYWGVRAEGADQWSNTWSFTTEQSSTNPPPSPPSVDGIVDASNSNFVIDGETFRFAGTNAYYLPNYEKLDPQFVTSTLDAFEDAGITVVRMWGFYDGYDCGYSAQDPSENVIQTAPGQYSEEALRDLDNVIAKGKERGIRFLLPFINYWDELGGICQYNTWAGASNPSTNMSYFINSNEAQQWFRDYISMLLNRVNTVTGVAYKNEPAIFGWEIMNEGRNTGADPAVLRDWYREIAQFIKSIDSNHLLTTGEEGFDEGTPSQYSADQYSNTYVLRAGEGTSYVMNTAIPEIDFGSAHWYPSDWGLGSSFNQSLVNAQHAWINDHKEIAEDFGKPFMVGEYGYAGWGNQTVLNIYNDMWNYAEQINLDGSFIWQLTTDYVKCYEFGGNICWPAGRQDADLYNSFRDHIQNIQQ